ncbi:helix-turn-helix transcriptional regulator [Spirillospora sp. NPDC000708]|uniref:Helix-turn-helix transcriptional regulator n=1 Tax=Actinomadura violacea TaxID=2819934 RepID=A0ABS3RYK9_9ACTN|nr:helix-turn-helix transcriptional regulator [Actinomadura violacea]MBO2461124.1 helix-turn-helix transcriptional regulator [Actinomadura violacea]
MTDRTWWEYVVRTAGTDNQSEIARKIGRDQSSLNKWPQGAKPRVESVRAFADGYGRPILEAMVAAGILTEEEARQGL